MYMALAVASQTGMDRSAVIHTYGSVWITFVLGRGHLRCLGSWLSARATGQQTIILDSCCWKHPPPDSTCQLPSSVCIAHLFGFHTGGLLLPASVQVKPRICIADAEGWGSSWAEMNWKTGKHLKSKSTNLLNPEYHILAWQGSQRTSLESVGDILVHPKSYWWSLIKCHIWSSPRHVGTSASSKTRVTKSAQLMIALFAAQSDITVPDRSVTSSVRLIHTAGPGTTMLTKSHKIHRLPYHPIDSHFPNLGVGQVIFFLCVCVSHQWVHKTGNGWNM